VRRQSFPEASILALILGAVGCGDDTGPVDAGDADVGTDASDSGEYVPSTPMPPTPPALPSFGACPTGWSAVDVEGATACEPWPDEGPGCTGDEVRFPGDDACAPLGTACAADGWPSDLPFGVTVFYVRAGASGGDGSRAAPYGTITEAIAVVASGDVIALATGTYGDVFVLPENVSLVGACVTETILRGPPGGITEWTVQVPADASIRNLTIAGERPGVWVYGGTTRLEDVVVSAQLFGLIATDDGTIDAERVVVRDTAPGAEYGIGVFVNRRARVELRRALLEGNSAVGIAVDDPDASVLLEDVAIREMNLRATGDFGSGVVLNRGSTGTLTRVVIERIYSSGVFVQFGSTATLDTVVVRDVSADTAMQLTGHGIAMSMEGTVVGDRIHLERTTAAAILGVGFRLDLTLRDLIIEEVASQPFDLRAGVGVYVDSAPAVRLERVLSTRARGAAIGGVGTGTMIDASDVTIVSPLPEEAEDREVAGAIEVREGVSMRLARVSVEGTEGAAIIISDAGTELELEDALLVDNLPTAGGLGGRGISVQVGARFSCTRCEVDASGEVAIMALGPGGESTLRDVRITATTSNPENGAGMGLVAIEGALVDMERFVVAAHAVAGLQLVTEGMILARDGVISDNPVGVNAQYPVDPADLTDRVVYRDNGLNLDSAALPVPSGGL